MAAPAGICAVFFGRSNLRLSTSRVFCRCLYSKFDSMIAQKVNLGTYAPYFQTYIDLVEEEDLIEALFGKRDPEWKVLLDREEDVHYAYAKGKWSIGQVVRHVIDTERIFQFRALSIAREQNADLPGFDHDAYVDATKDKDLKRLLLEFKTVRNSSISLFSSFSKEELMKQGKANGNDFSVISLGYMIAGHARYHWNKIEELY